MALGGGLGTPSVFSRGGSLLPSIYADARYIDAAIVQSLWCADVAAAADQPRGIIYLGVLPLFHPGGR